MSILYINYNGQLIREDQPIHTVNNRAFRYGDGLFETMLWKNGDIRFLNFHVERLQESMNLLKLDNPNGFDTYFIKTKTEELVRKNSMIGQEVRVRLSIFRNGEGLYTPQNNEPSYIFQISKVEKVTENNKLGLIVDLYTEHKKPYSELAKVKSNNAMIYVLAGVFKRNQGVDEVLLLNQEGHLCEASASNIFILFDKTIYTPALNQACIDGVMRRVVMDMAEDEGMNVVEAQINPEIMKKADEIFCTNAIQGVQWVMGYKQKRYFNKVSRMFQQKLLTWNYDE